MAVLREPDHGGKHREEQEDGVSRSLARAARLVLSDKELRGTGDGHRADPPIASRKEEVDEERSCSFWLATSDLTQEPPSVRASTARTQGGSSIYRISFKIKVFADYCQSLLTKLAISAMLVLEPGRAPLTKAGTTGQAGTPVRICGRTRRVILHRRAPQAPTAASYDPACASCADPGHASINRRRPAWASRRSSSNGRGRWFHRRPRTPASSHPRPRRLRRGRTAATRRPCSHPRGARTGEHNSSKGHDEARPQRFR